MSAPNSGQKSTDEEGEPSKPNEPDEPIQEVSWYDIPVVPHEPDQNGKAENEVPIQEVSWYTIPGVPDNEISPYSPQIMLITSAKDATLKAIQNWEN